MVRTLMPLRFPGSCSSCYVVLSTGTDAWWSVESETVTCRGCADDRGVPDTASPWADPPPRPVPQVSAAGRSAQRTYEERRRRNHDRTAKRWGRAAGIVNVVQGDPQSTSAWAKGARGERLVGRRLDTLSTRGITVLHDRSVPGTRANVDHVVVAPSGVWVIDTKNLAGTVERREQRRWFTSDRRLYIRGRDQTKLIDNLAWQVNAVRKALGDHDSVPVRAVLCIVADWPLLTGPFLVRDVLVTPPRRLVRRIARPGTLSDIAGLADRLATGLPPA